MSENKRKGKGFAWTMNEHTGFGSREISGFTVDNLNTKTLSEAESEYEKVFILVRTTLESRDSFCMDNESERLQVCQDVSDSLRKSGLLSSPVKYN